MNPEANENISSETFSVQGGRRTSATGSTAWQRACVIGSFGKTGDWNSWELDAKIEGIANITAS